MTSPLDTLIARVDTVMREAYIAGYLAAINDAEKVATKWYGKNGQVIAEAIRKLGECEID